MDAIAVPFVQGRLRKESLTFQVVSECAHCSRPLHLKFDNDLNYKLREQDASPLVFSPSVDFDKLEDPSIIDAF
jgi:hypothetical protein